MGVAILLSITLVVASTLLHYEVLRALFRALPRLRGPVHVRLVYVLLAAFFAHLLEILLFALAYYVLIDDLALGTLGGTDQPSLANCFYFSAETYTALGFGDLFPLGSVRLVVGAEALCGLLMIAWSASYTYLAMQQFWDAAPPPRSGPSR